MINGVDGEGGDVAEVQRPFAHALANIFTWIRNEFRGD
jgi:hypothetical protein